MSKMPRPAVDVVIEYQGGVVLVQRKNPPLGWALPGGFVDYGESVEDAARREAREETGLELEDMRQFRVYSDPERDPRGHTLTTVFLARGRGAARAADDAAALKIADPAQPECELAFDHDRILADYQAEHAGFSTAALSVLQEKQANLQGRILQRGSAFSKYRDIVIGKKGFFSFLKYELITFFLASLGGAIGLVLRKFFFRRLLGGTGPGVVFGRHLTIRHPHKIKIGANVVIDDYVVLDAKGAGNQGITIGDNCFIGRDTVLSCKEGNIELESFVAIGNGCSLISESRLHIGQYSYLAGHCYLVAGGNHKYNRLDVPIMLQDSEDKGGIVLEGDNWLGAGVQVLDGSRIGRGTIVGAGSTVYRSLAGRAIAVGVPALVSKRRSKQE